MANNEGQKLNELQLKLDEKEIQGTYSNIAVVHHHAEEFTLNFIYVFPSGTQGKFLSSIIVSPGHAKRLWQALGTNIAAYETQFGPIKELPAASVPSALVQ